MHGYWHDHGSQGLKVKIIGQGHGLQLRFGLRIGSSTYFWNDWPLTFRYCNSVHHDHSLQVVDGEGQGQPLSTFCIFLLLPYVTVVCTDRHLLCDKWSRLMLTTIIIWLLLQNNRHNPWVLPSCQCAWTPFLCPFVLTGTNSGATKNNPIVYTFACRLHFTATAFIHNEHNKQTQTYFFCCCSFCYCCVKNYCDQQKTWNGRNNMLIQWAQADMNSAYYKAYYGYAYGCG